MGFLSSIFGGDTKQQTVAPIRYGTFGETGPDKDAIKLKTDIYNRIPQIRPQADQLNNQIIGGLQTASAHPLWQNMLQLSGDQMQGKYLNSPQALKDQSARMMQAAQRGAADQNADIRSSYARNGMRFSTANQEAEMASAAAARAKALDTASNIEAQNYQRERGIQQTSGDMAASAIEQPINIMAQTTKALYDPLQKEAGIIVPLGSGGSVNNPEVMVTQKPGYLDYAQKVMGTL